MSTPATPAGMTRATYLSGRNAPSRIVSSLRVARIPRTSHVSFTVTPFVPRVRYPWTIFGAAGSLVSIEWTPRRVQTGVRLPNALCPVSLQPPSTRSAFVVERRPAMSFPCSACPAANTSPAAASFRIHSQDLSPLRQRSAAVPTQ